MEAESSPNSIKSVVGDFEQIPVDFVPPVRPAMSLELQMMARKQDQNFDLTSNGI